MFETLNLRKTMFFKDKPQQNFEAALLELSQAIGIKPYLNLADIEDKLFNAETPEDELKLSEALGITGDLSISAIQNKFSKPITSAEIIRISQQLNINCINFYEIEERLNHALTNQAQFLMSEVTSELSSQETLLAFHRWATNIHNDNLAVPPGARFPNNIVYDMISTLRNNPQSQIVLRFFMEGLNARKISKGETPTVDFISTSLMLDVLSSLPKPLSPKGRDFRAKYDTISAFAKAQQQLEIGMTALKNNPLFGFLSSKDIFNFSKTLNPITGANAYGLSQSLDNGLRSIKDYPADKLNTDLQSMVTEINATLIPVLAAFSNAKSSQPARLLTFWDASEFICRAIVALQIAALKEPAYLDLLDGLLDNPIIREIFTRSEQGNFPAKARNDDIESVEVAELFLQSRIAAEARPRRLLKA